MKARMLIAFCLIVSIAPVCGCGGGGGGGDISYTVTFIKADGTEIAAASGEVEYPMTLTSSFRITFAEAIAGASERTAIEALVALIDPNDNTVDGAFSWSDDFTQITFTPSRRLGYGKTYTVNITASSADASLSQAAQIVEGSVQFKTMIEGDTNGDGYAEVTVGAYGWDAAASQTVYSGACYIYNGSPDGAATTYARRLTGETDDRFCISWDTADINGDGYADFFAGAPGNGSNVGAMRVYHGSADGIPETPNTTITGNSSTGDGNFGDSVAKAGDVNGDGYDDIIVGSTRHDEGGIVDAGAVYVFLGSADGLSTTPSTSFFGTTTNNFLGWSAASAGDVNGDGFDDVIASAPGVGTVYVHLGSADGVSATPATTLSGETPNDAFGFRLAPGGDINGDGFDDVLVGALNYNGGFGATYIFNGSADGISTDYSARLVGESATSNFGYPVPTGDVNGDGFDDLVVGAPLTSGLNGAAFFYQGSADGIVETASAQWNGSGGEFLGITIPGRDANGDGFYDVILGAPYWNTRTGRVQIYDGSSEGPGSVAAIRTGENNYDWYSITFELN